MEKAGEEQRDSNKTGNYISKKKNKAKRERKHRKKWKIQNNIFKALKGNSFQPRLYFGSKYPSKIEVNFKDF